MKMFKLPVIVLVIVVLASCNGAENKADGATNETTINKEEKSGSENIQQDLPPVPAAAAPEDSIGASPDNNEILARIDQYLVSKPEFQANGSGISNAVVTVKNTLTGTTFQKAIVEVNALSADGKIIRNDFYTIQNIEPGDLETIKIPAIPKAASLTSHVVKIKSNELTNGEMVLAGTHFGQGQ
ncbi:MAG: hypothetical protein IPP99_20330 [Chitinophagaceae bacterium]|nr:hypothetical protein [Chitinophagaceae bacterium]